MKVIADRAALLEALNFVAAVVPQRTPNPALSCVKLSATRSAGVSELTLAGTDAENSLSLSLTQVDVSDPGVAVVNAQKIQQIVANIDHADPTVSLELEGDLCTIKGSNSRFKIMSYPSADFPPLPDFDAAQKAGGGPGSARAVFTLSAGALLRLISRTAFAVARETSRYAINGVLLKRDGKKLEMVATDGRRLALCKGQTKSGSGDVGTGASSCIVPSKALSFIQRLAGDPESLVRVALTDNRVFFGFLDAGDEKKGGASAGGPPRAVLSSALVEGAFPPYEDVIPKDQDKRVAAGTDDLARAVRQASVLTNEESRGVKLAFSAKGKRLKISSRAPEVGESEIEIPLSDYQGDDLEISFNPQFISEVLKAIDESEVRIEMKAPNKPGLMRAGEDFVYVVMPVNLPA